MSDLLPIQQDRLREIGVQLKQAREQKQLSLDDVSAKTLIRATILRAIEEGDTRPLPEPVYIKGFIRRFGDLVGLGGRELSDSFPWQPSQSVPAGFVTSGSIVAVTPQKTVATVPVAAAQPLGATTAAKASAQAGALPLSGAASGAAAMAPAEPMALQGDEGMTAAEGIAADVDAGMAEVQEQDLDPPSSIETGTGDAPETTALSPELSPEPSPERDAEVQPKAALPDVDGAYASRAALFDEAIAPDPVGSSAPRSGDEAAEAAVMAEAATMASAPGISTQPSDGSQRQETTQHQATGPSAAEIAQPLASAPVATLPPPPAPVTYQDPQERRMLPVILGLLGLGLGIGVAAIALSNRTPQGQLAQPPAETPAEIAAEPPAAPAEPETPALPAGKVVMDLEVRGEDAWVIVAVDGVDQLEGLQTAGFKQRWEGDEQIQLWTPRPDLVWISVNGGPQQPFGPLSELSDANPIKTASFKPEGGE